VTFNDVELAALESGMQRIGIFFRLDTSPVVVRLWLGFGDIQPGVNVYDLTGAEYRGLGEITNVPAFKQLLNGAAERVEFTLSGVSGKVLQIASDDDAEEVKGRRTAVGFALMDRTWAMIGVVHWCAYYVADFLSVQQSAADPMAPIVRTIALSCSTRFTGRRRPSLSYFSDQDQQRRYPGDLFCNLAGRYAHGFNKAWPQFT
jgi:hypothetical protein